MKQIDDWIIAQVQAAYLWLLDHTGVYLGTCATILLVIGRAAWIPTRVTGGPVWIDVLVILYMIHVFHGIWKLQRSRNYAQMNMRATLWREHFLRRVLLVTWPFLPFFDVYVNWETPVAIVGALLDSVCGYIAILCLPACYTRDREPPEKRLNQPVSAGI